jgi:DNA repair exonuclease SbcCD ATPase subunit
MELLNIYLKNIFSYELLFFDFSIIEFALFQGLNGSGKSFFFDSICLGIFGTTPRKKYKTFIRDTPKKCATGIIKIEFKIDGSDDIYRIERIFGKGKGLHLFKNGIEIKFRLSSLVQEEIEKIIGMNFKTFLNVCYFSQGDIGKFLISDSGDRINTITDISDLTAFDRARKSSIAELKNYELKLKGLRSKLSVYNDIVATVDLKKLSKLKRMYETVYSDASNRIGRVNYNLVSIKEKIELLNKKESLRKECDQIIDKYDLIKREYGKNTRYWKTKIIDSIPLIKKIKDISECCKGADGIENEINDIKKKIAKLQKLNAKADAEIGLHEKSIKTLTNAVRLKGKRCHYCHSLVGEENMNYITEHTKVLGGEIKKLELMSEQRENKIEAYEQKIKKLNKQFNKFNLLIKKSENLQRKIKDSHSAFLEISGVKKRYKAEKVNIVNELRAVKARLKNINKDIKDYDEFNVAEFDDIELEYNKIEKQLSDAESKIKIIKYKMGQHNNAYRKAKRIEKKIEAYDSRFNYIRWWIDNYPIIKLEIINDVIPFIESENNKYLSKILPGKFVKYILNTDRKNNKLDIIINDYENGKSRAIEGFSGGQRERMALATYLALNKLATIKSGKRINFLILDEKFVGVDAMNIPQVISLLADESDSRKIMVISHAEKIESGFKQIVYVNNKKGVTGFEIKETKNW